MAFYKPLIHSNNKLTFSHLESEKSLGEEKWS